ncbi:type III-B CRISPR-associated protein Cas10/Cmr2 [Zoogloea sp.]|uniref:type III-B CRISPR-associated protein Cas10/Cmr2 n=1 Tax=Zoogloea sp. TaxID=49181 RepID=UPI0035B34616
MENKDIIWQTKLAARIHDPAEKALVLLRDPAGHEGGSIVGIGKALGFETHMLKRRDGSEIEKLKLPSEMERIIGQADRWAAASDRPQWPMDSQGKYEKWAQVHWSNRPMLIHPLTGTHFDLHSLADTDFHDIKQRSFKHFSNLLVALGAKEGEEDLRKTLLAFWRFGPELNEEADNGKLGPLWQQLPADTRVPDHSIWDHLDLTSAFAGAFAADPNGEAALLALSIGPVQPFIAAARSTSDLWAGSHLLSRLSWEAMRPVCEALGPDAILFPRLRGVPQVDLWLRDRMDLPNDLFERREWNRGGTDSNPLFSAALPNRFVAVVPASRAKAIAESVESDVRAWLQSTGRDVVSRLLDEAGFDTETPQPYAQMQEQLAGFPAVHWAAVPFSLITAHNKEKQTDLDTVQLSQAMAPFFGVEPGQPCGFLDTPAWKVLQGEGHDSRLFAPNPGALYPAIYELAERVMAAAKAVRPFSQIRQEGWRCSLTGETEWLTTDREQLKKSYRQQPDTLWARIAKKKPSWAKKGEHLGALPAIKRLWPTLFAEEVGKALSAVDNGEAMKIGRFVVSTHTMALAHQLDQWLKDEKTDNAETPDFGGDSVALPRKLLKEYGHKRRELEIAKRLPGLLDAADEEDNDTAGAQAERLVRQTLGVDNLEAYFALLLMDGDRMGQMLSGDPQWAISYCDSFHPQVKDGFKKHAANQPAIKDYGAQKRALSPNRHLAISGALNDFSLIVVRHVVEEEHLGRVIYAGGDDVLAMLPVVDALPAAQRLRHAYSGVDPAHDGGRDPRGLTLHKGFAILKGKLMRMMGHTATASCGIVIAHHQAPLATVRRELEAAERRAKNAGRDRFSITVIKRSGGALKLTAEWGEPLKLLNDLRCFLREEGVSRRAVYNTAEWLHDLPEPESDTAMLANLLAYQMDRQADKAAGEKHDIRQLAQRLATLAVQQPKDRLKWLANFMSVAEFLARETRSGASE